ncbi:uncharacterized protein BDR25DRAFT_378111 [Lindgomyces ingoldianus]|uniref:Uncharacterized protein n=1 Tax=Lindgomyces ingoldianus TaxID=673940 RepID=A0ACB6QFZ8_9PLEO|nr:uncharacterized protein BDR25DRAFT_378111 [Lindgomyces ingoldianus]KAF2465919.1 hypothetical protein BDR25DRAFT_378111 [Lindgomyces ingoldianus]
MQLMASFWSKIPIPTGKATLRKPPRDSKIAESSKPVVSSSSIDITRPDAEKEQPTQLPSPPPEPKEKVAVLNEEQLHALFSGAPQFGIQHKDNNLTPTASYPWDAELTVKDVSDSAQLAQPAFSAATLYPHLPLVQEPFEEGKPHQSYDVGTVEVPSMLSAQGIEPGSIGFVHFLQLPRSDNLATDLQQSQSSNEFLQAAKNKEHMQSDPQKLGIREVDHSMVYERLTEFGDLLEALQDSPERMTILNNQSSGELYANLFGKFLYPPKWDGSTEDPTGMKVQIDTLLKVLRLKGVWYDFSLVEWRIRLGQILWSDSDTPVENDITQPHQLWSDRDILLLQICLSCELLLRLDAVTSMDADEVKQRMHVTPEEFQGFLDLQTKKTNWDLILAQRFLDNILVVRESDPTPLPQSPKSGLLSMLGRSESKGPPKPDLILLPRHQARQLSGLLNFAETVQWPGIDLVVNELAQKLGVSDNTAEPEQQLSPYGKFLEPTSPSISIYGTPLATSTSSPHDSYFGHMTRPSLSRSNSRSLKVPLFTNLLSHAADGATGTLNIGGWLSRSYLTGLILPGEAISHFLMSTLLENDKLAIAALGDSANLYGGFVYADRTWWSKSSIVGRVLACIEGASECMGWISIGRLPELQGDGWYALSSEQLPFEQPSRIAAKEDLLGRDSAIVPCSDTENIKPEDLTLPLDPSTPPIPSIGFLEWNLTSIISELSDTDSSSQPEAEAHVASITFTSFARGTTHVFPLTYDVQFISSFPCTPPLSFPMPNFPQVLKRSLSRSSSKRSVRSARSGIRPSRHLSRRNSHGYEPLLSHPPDSAGLPPTRTYSPPPDEEDEDSNDHIPTPQKSEPMTTHPLHVSYKYKIVSVTEILDPNFEIPLKIPITSCGSPAPSNPDIPLEEKEDTFKDEERVILVLDARSSKELELLARAWCADKGLHAIIGRVGRTCLACCVREARGLGVSVVVRA